jgi:hypothetical protein
MFLRWHVVQPFLWPILRCNQSRLPIAMVDLRERAVRTSNGALRGRRAVVQLTAPAHFIGPFSRCRRVRSEPAAIVSETEFSDSIGREWDSAVAWAN